jgi:hypothetical protein
VISLLLFLIVNVETEKGEGDTCLRFSSDSGDGAWVPREVLLVGACWLKLDQGVVFLLILPAV